MMQTVENAAGDGLRRIVESKMRRFQNPYFLTLNGSVSSEQASSDKVEDPYNNAPRNSAIAQVK
jgi:hypothetical protein